jgi:hypothetical protein
MRSLQARRRMLSRVSSIGRASGGRTRRNRSPPFTQCEPEARICCALASPGGVLRFLPLARMKARPVPVPRHPVRAKGLPALSLCLRDAFPLCRCERLAP